MGQRGPSNAWKSAEDKKKNPDTHNKEKKTCWTHLYLYTQTRKDIYIKADALCHARTRHVSVHAGAKWGCHHVSCLERVQGAREAGEPR